MKRGILPCPVTGYFGSLAVLHHRTLALFRWAAGHGTRGKVQPDTALDLLEPLQFQQDHLAQHGVGLRPQQDSLELRERRTAGQISCSPFLLGRVNLLLGGLAGWV